MSLRKNMELIREAIESLEYPKPFPVGVCQAYKDILEEIMSSSNIEENTIKEYEEYLIYYDRIKEEEEDLKRGRYPKKRVGFKV